MTLMPENKFGYLSLSIPSEDGSASILIRANRIVCIVPADDEEGMHISFGGKDGIVVIETIDEILEQMDNIHPDLL